MGTNDKDQPKCPIDTSSSITSWFWKTKQEPPKDISACPVDHHTTISKPIATNTITTDDQPVCPVDHNTRSAWIKNVSVSVTTPNEAVEIPSSWL
ncbi:uncharacterized protein J8A68_000493 [[Candida] subhashii]|uniref:Uncharacterized protein n=1 Tax=[Candida] subhashii TaxID=561895 RepID=A0A8J5UMF5_9ASCO|nr:uncharacterized protein J8A68_000493 [[Candida] subhashii]KAG7666063.1 hypothetical protein J8A68_000493 [[Candida] subhashii]